MIDRLDLYTLKNNLFHLYLDDNNIQTAKQLIKEKDFKNIEKLDVLYIILLTNITDRHEYSDNDLLTKTSTIINKLVKISEFNYTDDEIEKIKIFYFFLLRQASTLDEAIKYSKQIKKHIINDTTNLIPLIKYINEELRMILLEYYQFSNDIYDTNEKEIQENLIFAQQNKNFRFYIADILR